MIEAVLAALVVELVTLVVWELVRLLDERLAARP